MSQSPNSGSPGPDAVAEGGPLRAALSRRRMLTLAAGTAGAVTAASLLPPSVRTALASPPQAGGLKAIKHVVFLMQENRAFDHYYGTMRGVRGYGDRTAITLRDGNSVLRQPDGHGGGVLPFPVRKAAQDAHKEPQYIGDLDHSWSGGHSAWAGGWYNNWVPAKSPATMAYYDRQDLPFHYELAETFTICDAYHASVHSSTSPNRNYFVSGYTGYEPGTGKRATGNDAYDEVGHAGYSWTTYAERLERAGRSWQVYHEWDNFQDNNLEFFTSFKQIARKALSATQYKTMDAFYGALGGADAATRKDLLTKLEQGVATLTRAEKSLFDRALRRVESGALASTFRADVAAGRLPQVSYLVPSSADSEHPGASSPVQSARLTYEILDALASHPDVWASTVVFITYDENDGLFDHVPPPVPPAGTRDEFVDGQPLGLGIRVPMTVVSPWTAGGYVCSQVFDHSSLIRFTETWLGVRQPEISAWRRKVSGDLTSAFDFGTTKRRLDAPAAGTVPPFAGRWHPAPPADQKMPVQEQGVRPARPLPYQPDVSARLDPATKTLTLTMTNTGTASAHLTVYPYAGEFATPQHFDVDGAETLSVKLNGGTYRLVVTGPGGFLREFAGEVTGQAAVASSIHGRDRRVSLSLVNAGPKPVTFVIAPNAYAGTGESRPRKVTVAGRRTGKAEWKAAAAHGWYDLTVTVAGDPAFARRLTGHLQNGRPSVTG
ncbi:MAG: phospholipase phosphocholine-specific [Streptosporangiaceae bacterium]|nr:phospholipase phosphocholine-specific [Streptosporangiaceae bacterium]